MSERPYTLVVGRRGEDSKVLYQGTRLEGVRAATVDMTGGEMTMLILRVPIHNVEIVDNTEAVVFEIEPEALRPTVEAVLHRWVFRMEDEIGPIAEAEDYYSDEYNLAAEETYQELARHDIDPIDVSRYPGGHNLWQSAVHKRISYNVHKGARNGKDSTGVLPGMR